MATYRLKRKLYGIGDAARDVVGGGLQAAGGMADTTLGGVVGGVAAANSPLAGIVPGGAITAGLIGYAGTRAAGKILKNTGDDIAMG